MKIRVFEICVSADVCYGGPGGRGYTLDPCGKLTQALTSSAPEGVHNNSIIFFATPARSQEYLVE